MTKDPQNSYLKLRGIHKNEKACFVLAAGPSLFFDSRNKNFDKIFDHVVIFVNSSIMLMPKEKKGDKFYFCSTDSLCRRWSWWDKVLFLQVNKIVRSSWYKYREELPGFLYFKARSTPESIIEKEDDGLCYACSTAASIDLGLALGIHRIFVLGLDHYRLKGNGHFWDFFPSKIQKSSQTLQKPVQRLPAQPRYDIYKKHFKAHMRHYKALEGYSKTIGSRIYNCNLKSRVETFEKITFDDIFDIFDILEK